MRFLVPALALFAALLLAPGVAIGPSADAAVFAGIGDQLLAGDRLYKDAWDHKPPAVYSILAVGQAAFPWVDPWVVSWVLSVLATAGTGLGVAYAATRLGVRQGAAYVAAAAAVAFMAQYLTALGGGLTEPLAALPAAWALVLALSHADTPWRRLASGLLLGIALLTSLQLIPAALAVAGLWLATVNRHHRVRALVDLAVGGAIPWVISGLVLLAAGSLGAAVEALLAYGAAYRAASSVLGAELSRAPAAWTFLSALFLITGAALGGLILLRARDRRRWVVYAMAAWILLAVALFVAQGRFIAHYAIPLAIPLSVLAGVGLDATAARWVRATSPDRVALVLPLAVALIASLAAGLFGGRYELTANQASGNQVATAARYLREHSATGDQLLVWGNRPELYLAAERGPAIPYRFMYPLTTDGWVTPDLVANVLADMSADPPLLVVDAGSAEPGAPGFLPLLIDRPVAREGREVDMLDPLRDYIRANYELVAEVAGWPVYRVRGSEDG